MVDRRQSSLLNINTTIFVSVEVVEREKESRMSQIHECKESLDAVPLCPQLGLFLKPLSRINISVHFPSLKDSLPAGGKSVSSWDMMERLKALVLPDTFISIKVVKNTLEFLRFEGDLENRTSLKSVVGRLEGENMMHAHFMCT